MQPRFFSGDQGEVLRWEPPADFVPDAVREVGAELAGRKEVLVQINAGRRHRLSPFPTLSSTQPAALTLRRWSHAKIEAHWRCNSSR
jgi:hypothetical protein